jgi:adenylosuccinate synthase
LGRFDWGAAATAVQLNRPTRIAVNFLDYLDFRNRGVSEWAALTSGAKSFVATLEKVSAAKAFYMGTGPRLLDNVQPAADMALPASSNGIASVSLDTQPDQIAGFRN